jgi:hypothetical protein
MKVAKKFFKAIVLKECIQLGMTYQSKGNAGSKKVMKFKDVKQSWRQDCSPDNASKLFQALFGQFETRPFVDHEIECSLMDILKYKYDLGESTISDKQLKAPRTGAGEKFGGCVGKVASQALSAIRKQANDSGKKEHGKIVSIRKKVGDDSKNCRREKGRFLLRFIVQAKEIAEFDLNATKNTKEFDVDDDSDDDDEEILGTPIMGDDDHQSSIGASSDNEPFDHDKVRVES